MSTPVPLDPERLARIRTFHFDPELSVRTPRCQTCYSGKGPCDTAWMLMLYDQEVRSLDAVLASVPPPEGVSP